MLTRLDCTKCDRTLTPGTQLFVCDCGGPLFARYDFERAARDMRPGPLALRAPTLWRYREVLPLDDPQVRLSMGEGFTPLIPVSRLGERLGLPTLFVKDESANPTGSFEARGLAVAISVARSLGATEVSLSSTGNAASALAAYAARGGLRAHVFMPNDVPALFVTEARAFGATVELVDGLITAAAETAAAEALANGWYDCSTLHEPFRVEGIKTAGYELAEQFGFKLPDAILCPTGSGTGLIALWKAFDEMEEMGFIGPGRPRMYAVQASGCAPLVRAFEAAQDSASPWEGATTIAHGLRVPHTIGDFLVLRALHKSRGAAVAVSEEEIEDGVRRAAASEGILLSPEGGACVAAVQRLKSIGHITPDDIVVIINPGAGSRYAETLAPLW